MTRRLADLKGECQRLGLAARYRPGKRESKEDYISVLRAHYLQRDYPDGLPYAELSPMLCFPHWQLRPEEQRIWEDGSNWIVQPKINGCRMILHFVKEVGVFAHGRQLSLKTFRRQDYHDHLLFRDFVPGFDAVVDTEVVVEKLVDTRPYTRQGEVTKSGLASVTATLHLEADAALRLQKDQDAPLTFKVFDIVRWDGADLRHKKLCERLPYLMDLKAAIEEAGLGEHFNLLPFAFHGKKEFFEKVLKEAGEGCVLKNLNSSYIDSSSRRRNAWVKVKRAVEFDAYCSGFERGRPNSEWRNKIGCLHFSVVTEEGPWLVGKVTNIPFAFRKKISLYDHATDTLTINPQILGRVARVTGSEIAQRSYRLSHAKILHWRRELVREDCRYRIEDIRNGGLALRTVSGVGRIRGEERAQSDLNP